jgi:hypothetical protein
MAAPSSLIGRGATEVAIQCLARRMASSGNGHEHIARIQWQNDDTKTKGDNSTAEMVAFIEKEGDQSVYCPDKAGGKSAWVHVRQVGAHKFLQTVTDGYFTNNLLSLPLF